VPFKSQAQRRKFYALKAQGKMDQATIDEWEAETPKKLPDRVSTKTGAMAMNFWSGFEKRAAETYVQAAPAEMDPAAALAPGAIPPEKMLKWNEQGGVDPRTPEDLATATEAGLITLPHEVEGANCASCVHFRALNPQLGSGFCTNPAVKQDVTARMVCSLWEHPGSYSAAEQMAEDAALQQQADEQAAMAGQAVAEGDPMAQNIMADFQGQGAPGAEAPGAEAGGQPGGDAGGQPAAKSPKKESKGEGEKKKDSGKKPEGGGKGHTININVGKEKVATESFLAGFVGRMR
jgi:hypothetical protein